MNIFFLQALTQEQFKKADDHTKFCSEQVGIEYESAKKFRYAVISDDAESNQCFSKCFFERSGKNLVKTKSEDWPITLKSWKNFLNRSIYTKVTIVSFPETRYIFQGFMNDEGVMQKDVMFAKLGFEKDEETKVKLSKLIEKCTPLVGDNICNTAYKVHNCYWSHINPAPDSE